MLGALAGQTIGQYLFVEEIGKGGMAVVYKAYQSSISRYVAIKVLPKEQGQDPSFVKRFEGEAKAVAALEHPHILPVYDFGSQDAIIYMVMRLIEGGTLADLMNQGQSLADERVVEIVSDVASALDYAHTKGIVHRDVKPSNILIDQHHEVLLADFGLAKMMEGPYDARVTSSGIVVGTASYMAPERVANEPFDGRSDIYSLGVVLYELLAGHLPFDADTPMATALKHVRDPIPPLREINPNLPASLEQVVYKAMAKKSSQRYQTANKMREALKLALQTEPAGETAPPPTPPHTIEPDAVDLSYQQQAEAVPSDTLPSSGQIETPSTETKNLHWLWIGVAALIVILIALFVWQAFTPNTPESSLLHNKLVRRSEITKSLGPLENRYPRNPYARQYFNGGLIYWWDNPDGQDFMIVIRDASQADSGNNWSRHTDTWALTDPVEPEDCPETERSFGPVRGFGKLWCYNPTIKTDLGDPIDQELSGTDAAMEIFSEGMVFSIPLDNQTWVLLNDGSWQKFDME